MSNTAVQINEQEVEEAFRDCLFKQEELPADGSPPEGTVIVEGIVNNFGFHPERLEQKCQQVVEWLKALPHQFRKKGGGGWSFLNACNQEDGVQWTDYHQSMEQLFALGMGLGLIECQLPRAMWSILPGGMPYYAIDVE